MARQTSHRPFAHLWAILLTVVVALLLTGAPALATSELPQETRAAQSGSLDGHIQEPEEVLAPSNDSSDDEYDTVPFDPHEVSPDQDQPGEAPVSFVDEDGVTWNVVRSGVTLRSSQRIFEYFSFYSDDPFLHPATTYNHDLAQMSICMALSANRPIPYDTNIVVDADQFLVEYLEDCGFTGLREDDYDKTPSLYTVSTAMGHKVLTDEDGEPFTLVAVGVCGGNYKREWLSNVTVGTGVRHQGFDSAARLVTDRIFGYLGSNHITGRVKVWISGFSRAAAISNLTAANLVDSQAFLPEDVYAYTFATPRNTTDPNAADYDNIFNIVGPMDMVPNVAPANWGFVRYGHDLVLPGRETDSAFASEYAVLQKNMEDASVTTNYNPKLNLCLRLLVGMMYEALPTQGDYDSNAQEDILSILSDKSVQNVLRVIRHLSVSSKEATPDEELLHDQMIDFSGKFASGFVLGDEYTRDGENAGSLGTQIFHEHLEEIYLMWMASGLSAQELFDDHASFAYLLVTGEPALTVTDIDSGETVCTMSDAGAVAHASQSDNRQLAAFSFADETLHQRYSVIALPYDADYRVTWEATENSNGTIATTIIPSTTTIQPEYETYVRRWDDAEAGDSDVAYEARGNQIATDACTKMTMTSSDISLALGLSRLEGGWRDQVTHAVLDVCLLIIVLRALVATINQIGSNESWQTRFVCSSVILVALAESEVAYWLFASDPIQRLLWKTMAGAAMVLYCISCRSGRNDRQFWGILCAVVLCTAGDLAINFWFVPGLALFAVAHLFLIALFQTMHPLPKPLWFWWAVVSLISLPVTMEYLYAMPVEVRTCAMITAPVLLLVLFTGHQQRGYLDLGSFLLVVSDVLFAYFYADQSFPYVHMAYVLLYYLSLTIVCRSLLDEPESVIFTKALVRIPKHLRMRLPWAKPTKDPA